MNANDPIGIRADNLHNLVADALPDNGEWHALTSYVRKIDGVFQVDDLHLRRIVWEHSKDPRAPRDKFGSVLAEPLVGFISAAPRL